MEHNDCASCRRPKATITCGLCAGPVCKKCVEALPENGFSFLETVPVELTHRHYCPNCFFAKVATAQTEYEQTMRRARKVYVFNKSKSEETRLMSRHEKPLSVADCTDRDDGFMRLAFKAAAKGFNAVIDVELTSTKVRNYGYQTLRWDGSGVPTMVDAAKLEAQDKLGRWG